MSKDSDTKLPKDLSELLTRGKESDTKLIANGSSAFDVHMAIIMQRCPKLLARAEHKKKVARLPKPAAAQPVSANARCRVCDKKLKKCRCPKKEEEEVELVEEPSNEWQLEGYEPEILRELLRYAYTGRIDQSIAYAHVKTLLEKSRELELAELSELCSRLLGDRVQLDNSVDVLIFAEEMGCSELRDLALRYALGNRLEIVERGGLLDQLASRNARLLKILFERLVRLREDERIDPPRESDGEEDPVDDPTEAGDGQDAPDV